MNDKNLLGPLAFKDAAECQLWLDSLPLTDARFLQQALSKEIAKLNESDISTVERFRILEVLRETVGFAQSHSINKYSGKPVPLSAEELDAWNKVNGLWELMRLAYLRSLPTTVEEGVLSVAFSTPTVCQRAIHYTNLAMLEYYRVDHQILAPLWHELHSLYVIAEQRGWAKTVVSDEIDLPGIPTSCHDAYVRSLLTHLANPYGLHGKQLEILRRWLAEWSKLVNINTSPPVSTQLPLLVVDLENRSGAKHIKEALTGDSIRYLEMDLLGSEILKRLNLMREGHSPSQLGLGDNLSRPFCETLLNLLLVRWCSPGIGRSAHRRLAAHTAQVCLGIPAIHFFLSEKPFRQPEQEILSRDEHQDLFMFGRVTQRTEQQKISQLGYALESWEITNQSATGFGLIRDAENGERLYQNQLIAVRPPDGKSFLLCMVRWIKHAGTGELHVGTRLLPGIPSAAAARPTGVSYVGKGKFVQAILLPEVPALQAVASIVLPAGWYERDRVIEIYTTSHQLIKLQTLLDKGNDFERASIALIERPRRII